MRRQPFCLRSSEPPVHLGKSGTFFSLTRIGTREQGGSTSRFARYDVRSRRRRCMGPPEPVHPRLSGGPCGSSNAPLPRVRPSIHEDDVFALVRDAAGQAREIRSPCLRPSRPPVAETRDPATTVSRTIRSTVSSHRLRAPTAAPSRQDVLARRSDPACGSGRVRLRRDRRRLLRRTGTAVCPRVHRDALGRRTRYCRAGPGRESPNRSNARARRTPAGSRAAKTQTRSRRPPPGRLLRRDRRRYLVAVCPAASRRLSCDVTILPVGGLSVRVRDLLPLSPLCSIRANPRVLAAGRESLRLRSARRRRRRDRRLSSPGSALRSAPPYSPATWRPAGEVRHRPCFEGPSRQRHRTDTARRRPADRTDATPGQSRGTEDLGVPRVDRRIGRSLRPDDEVWRGSRHGCGRRRHQSQDRFYVFAPNGVRRQTAPDDRD